MAKSLHWVIAALVLTDFALGISFSHFDPGDVLYFSSAYGLHMSLGMILLVLSACWVIWRLRHPYPRLTQDMSEIWRLSARAVHFLLYVYIIIVPLVGWAILSFRERPAVLLGSLHWPNIGFLADLARPQRAYYHDIILPAHIMLSYIGIGLVGLHVAAALYHHFLRGGDVLKRMLPGMRLR